MWQFVTFLISDCDNVNASVMWTVVNAKSGTVAVEFNLMPKSCGYTSYRLDLYVDEKVTSVGECDNITCVKSLHSTRYVKILNHDSKSKTEISSCGKVCFISLYVIGCF